MEQPNTSLAYIDHDGAKRELVGCGMTVDKAGRFWLWSDQLKSNLAYRERSREACLLSTIDSLLFHLKLQAERIERLDRIVKLAEDFAEAVRPEQEES